MVQLFNSYFNKKELLRFIGSIDQLGGVKIMELSEGFEKGVRIALLKNGELTLTLALDRNMDIANAEYRNVPLAWISPTGITSPFIYDKEGLNWLRGFFGGLLTTCGLTYMGAPTIDKGEDLGLHGRIAYSPSKLKAVGGEWIDDDYIIYIEGESKEVKVFEPNLSLRRRIETKLGERKIKIVDTILNEGWEEQPLMLLYHFNFGFPLLNEGSKLISTSRFYIPRDKEAWKDVEEFDKFKEPIQNFKEKVYFHDMATDEEGYAYASIINPNLYDGLGVYIKFKKGELNRFYEWKMIGEGTYVLGLEPANALPLGRDKEREWGTLQYIKPQEERRFSLEVNVLEGKDEIEEFIKKVNSISKKVKPNIINSLQEFLKLTSSS
ncbi:MAG: aldose 1-epimerase family protein [Nitrososphaerales archaeon]